MKQAAGSPADRLHQPSRTQAKTSAVVTSNQHQPQQSQTHGFTQCFPDSAIAYRLTEEAITENSSMASDGIGRSTPEVFTHTAFLTIRVETPGA